jgi:hypothetical protein
MGDSVVIMIEVQEEISIEQQEEVILKEKGKERKNQCL